MALKLFAEVGGKARDELTTHGDEPIADRRALVRSHDQQTLQEGHNEGPVEAVAVAADTLNRLVLAREVARLGTPQICTITRRVLVGDLGESERHGHQWAHGVCLSRAARFLHRLLERLLLCQDSIDVI